MKIKQKVNGILIGALLVLGLTLAVLPVTAMAATNNGCEADTAILNCENVNTGGSGVQNTGVWSILLTGINILTGAVAVAAVAGVIYGSILYTSAGGNQEQTKKAMGIITNVVIGIITYALMYSGLNFLIPGGIFN